LRAAGQSLAAIAQQLALPPATVRDVWRRYRDHGPAGLAVQYARCGRSGVRFPAALYEQALALKRAHPRWGAPLLRLELAEPFPHQPLPGVRTLQTWWQQAGLTPPRAVLPPVAPQRAQQVHEVWEVDAKEQLRLQDGTGVSVLTIVDEGSGALLGLVPFPPRPLDPGARYRRPGGFTHPVPAVGPAAAHPRG
jgi:hypothetical protein